MKKTKPKGPEVMCISSRGNEPGLNRENALTPLERVAARQVREREGKGRRFARPNKSANAAQLEEMRAAAAAPID